MRNLNLAVLASCLWPLLFCTQLPGQLKSLTSTDRSSGKLENEKDARLRIEKSYHIGEADISGEAGDVFTWQSIIDLGVLDGDQNIDLELSVTANRHISFDSIGANCKCNKVKVSEKQFCADKPQAVKLGFKTIQGNPEGKSAVSLTFRKNGIDFGNILLRYELSNSIHLEKSRIFVVRPGTKKLQVPFYFTQPISAQTLKLSWNDPHENDVVCRCIEKEGHHFVELQLGEESKVEFVSGNLTLSDPVADVTANCSVMITYQDIISISPTLLRFQTSEKDGSKSLIASALLRLNPQPREDKGDKSSYLSGRGSISSLAASMGGGKLLTQTKELGNGIYRVKIWGDEKQIRTASQQSDCVSWEINAGESVFSRKAIFSLED